jgi:hypothetical protein
MTMTVEFGTLTPTSTIVVEIRISALPAANLSMPACTSLAFMSPEIASMRTPGYFANHALRFCAVVSTDSTPAKVSESESSISGQIT